MNHVAIRAEALGKRYRIGRRERYRTLRDTLAEFAAAPLRRIRAAFGGGGAAGAPMEDDTIWALRDVSFEVRPGEVVGVIGRNGSGKTTLLKILSRVTDPTAGYAEVFGRAGALLEVGTGFHPELTGRENIYLNGAILGMKRAEIEKKFDAIVDFSGNERFLDTPMKRYSSGMYMRLAFAVAAHLDPEILLVDEVLAVGDLAFQEKCLNKMNQVARTGRTILFVSHNLAAVRRLCTRTILLERGRIHSVGETERTIQVYLESMGRARTQGLSLEACERDGSGSVRAVSLLVRAAGSPDGYLRTAADADFIIGYRARESRPIKMLSVGIVIMDALGANVFTCGTGMVGRNFRHVPPDGQVICRVMSLPLIPGTYSVHVGLKDEEAQADYVYNAATFTVINEGDSELLDHLGPRGGSIAVASQWSWAEPTTESREASGTLSGVQSRVSESDQEAV